MLTPWDVLFDRVGAVLPYLGITELVALVAAFPDLDVAVCLHLNQRFGLGPPVPMVLLPDEEARMHAREAAASGWLVVTRETMCALAALSLPVRLSVWCKTGRTSVVLSNHFQGFLEQVESVYLACSREDRPSPTGASELMLRLPHASSLKLTRFHGDLFVPDTVRSLWIVSSPCVLRGCKRVRRLRLSAVPQCAQPSLFESVEELQLDLDGVVCAPGTGASACPLRLLAEWAESHPTLQSIVLTVSRNCLPHRCPITHMPSHIGMHVNTDGLSYVREILWCGYEGPHWPSRKRRGSPVDMCPPAG